MQKITCEQLIEKAVALLNDGTVSCVLGWKKGEFDYDITPALFETEEELKNEFDKTKISKIWFLFTQYS